MNDMRMGFMEIRGLCSTFHQVLAMEENFDTSSLDTEDATFGVEWISFEDAEKCCFFLPIALILICIC